MFANRKARLAVVCLVLTAVTACSRRHDSNDFLPSSPEFQKALSIVLASLSVPADGDSTVRVEAQISPDADADKRTVRFETTLGSWVDPVGDAGGDNGDNGGNQAAGTRQVERQADLEGKAAAFLRSATEAGVAVVTVSVLDGDGNALATVTGEVSFVEVSGALVLQLDATETFADGESVINLEAQISADSPSSWKTVTFETTFGSLDGREVDDATGKSPAVDIPTDGNRIARARLTSKKEGTASVKATIKEFPEASAAQSVVFVAAQQPEISTEPDSLNFGQVAVGSSADLQLAIGNHGPVPLTVTDWVPEPSSAGFSVPLAPPRPATIPTLGSIQITVRFSPGSAGTKTASLNIKSDDPERGELKITLAGEGVTAEPNIGVAPTSLDFGDVAVAGETKDLVVTVSNTGLADLSVTDISSSNPVFTVESSTSFTVVPGGSRPVTVRFDPDMMQPESGVLTIESNDPQTPETAVGLEGAGNP